MSFVFDPCEIVSSPIAGQSARFPVHRIYCVGRNYAAHAREMGIDPDREPPFFFLKPTDALVTERDTVPYPTDTDDFQYEAELVIAIGKSGTDVPIEHALDHVYGYAVGVDLTRRDRQLAARHKGQPWDRGKGFDLSAPMSEIHPAAVIGHPNAGRIWLSVDGGLRQEADIGQMIWSVPEIVSIVSRSWELRAGDLIFSGTPDKVGPVQRGETIALGVEGVASLEFRIDG